MIRAWLATAALVTAGLLPPKAPAHHSFAASFEVDRTIELEGEVIEVSWRNPHVEFDLSVVGESGREQIWTIESLALSGLRRRDIVEPFVSVGDRVRIAGNPGRRETGNIYLSHLMLPQGGELVLRGDEPRWSDETVAQSGASFATEGDGSAPELGIFRVWSTPSASPFPWPENVDPELAHTNFPLGESARATLESFDLIDDSPIKDCALKGMPTIMEQPYPMQFIERDDGHITLHLEEYDTIRTIYVGEGAADIEVVPDYLGHSVGRWQGDTLVVETTQVNWGWYDTVGIPLSADAHMLERFTLAADGSRLDWEMTVTDPSTFTEAVTVEKYYLYIPGVAVQPFECTV